MVTVGASRRGDAQQWLRVVEAPAIAQVCPPEYLAASVVANGNSGQPIDRAINLLADGSVVVVTRATVAVTTAEVFERSVHSSRDASR
jgi:hypothetical protein